MKITSGANPTHRYMQGFYNCLNILMNFAKLYLDFFLKSVISLILLFTMFFHVYVFYFLNICKQTSYKPSLKKLQTFFIIPYLKRSCERVMRVSSGYFFCFTFAWTVQYLLPPFFSPPKQSPNFLD